MKARALVAVVGVVLVAAGAAISIEASTKRERVTATDCRGTTGQSTTVLRGGLVDPVYVAATPSEPGRLYVVEKRGRVRILEHGRLRAAPFLDLRSSARHRGEEGLLSIAFHPRYRENRLVYVAFDDLQGDVNLVEYRTDGRQGPVADGAVNLLRGQARGRHLAQRRPTPVRA